MNLDKIKNLVIQAFIENPETKDNHNLLILHVWALQNPAFKPLIYALGPSKICFELSNSDSIIRQARFVQNGDDGRFRPSEKALASRKGVDSANTLYYRDMRRKELNEKVDEARRDVVKQMTLDR